MQFDENGVCMGCRMSDGKLSFGSDEYLKRKNTLLKDITRPYLSVSRIHLIPNTIALYLLVVGRPITRLIML